MIDTVYIHQQSKQLYAVGNIYNGIIDAFIRTMQFDHCCEELLKTRVGLFTEISDNMACRNKMTKDQITR